MIALSDGPGVAAVCTSPTGAAEDNPALFRFSDGNPQGKTINDFRPLLFQYGEHSNHFAPAIAAVGRALALLRPEGIRWFGAAGLTIRATSVSRYGQFEARISSSAAAANGRLAVGWVVGENDNHAAVLQNVAVLEEGKPLPVWVRTVQACKDVDSAAAPAAGLYGPHTQLRDERVWAPFSIAIDPQGVRIAVADYQGYERFVLPRTPDEALRPARSLGHSRFTPSRPTIHVYDVGGKEVRRFPTPLVFPNPAGSIWPTRVRRNCLRTRIIGPVAVWRATAAPSLR